MVQTLSSVRPARRSRTDRAAARKHEILIAASRVFRRRGLHATGMREIATEMGMHVGNLYYYFESKQDLLAYCQDETLSLLLGLARDVEASSAPVVERLRRLICGHVRTLNEDMPASLAHLEVEALEPARRRTVLRRRRRYERVFRRLIEEGISVGVFRQQNAKVATLAILGAVNWTVKWYRSEGQQTADEIGDEFADLLVRGLRVSDAAATPARRSRSGVRA